MIFDNFQDSLKDSILSIFAVDAEYSPTIDDPDIEGDVSCQVVISHDVLLQPSDYDARVVETGTTIEALHSDVSEPRKGSQFDIGGVIYTVERITDNNRVFVKMVVTEG